jgi:RNA-directed DNA polymerase
MGQKHKHLFDQIIHPDNLWSAYRKASLGKRQTLGYLMFRQSEAANLHYLRTALADGSYRPGEPRTFLVYEPKPREISALPFLDARGAARFVQRDRADI